MPVINGTLFRHAKHLTFRDVQQGDKNHLGEPIPQGKKVIVLKKDCEENEDGTLDPYTAEPIPQIPSEESDRRIYGEWKKQRDREGQWIEGEWAREYYTCPVYLVRDGKVLLGTIYSKNDPRLEDLRRINEQKMEEEKEDV